jgi:hypothetical protein
MLFPDPVTERPLPLCLVINYKKNLDQWIPNQQTTAFAANGGIYSTQKHVYQKSAQILKNLSAVCTIRFEERDIHEADPSGRAV